MIFGLVTKILYIKRESLNPHFFGDLERLFWKLAFSFSTITNYRFNFVSENGNIYTSGTSAVHRFEFWTEPHM